MTYHINFEKPIHVHFIGIGGISMSGLAQILLDAGFTVSGSDAKRTELTDHLSALGAQIQYPQKAENITQGIDLVVYTAAIAEDNPEFTAAKQQAVPIITRADLLGQIMKNYKMPIAISGTHGKTAVSYALFRTFYRRKTWTLSMKKTISCGLSRKRLECFFL